MLLVLVVTLGCIITTVQSHYYQETLSQQILRFHVLANSDSQQDQQLKLQVRDVVGIYMGDLLKNAQSLEESQTITKQHLDDIEQIAYNEIVKRGYNYSAEASLETVEFPEKKYGDYTFPKGKYHALRLVIGTGCGQNWWCVMYPNLCFADSVYQVIDEGKERKQKELLTISEYRKLIESPEKKIEFKLLDGI